MTSMFDSVTQTGNTSSIVLRNLARALIIRRNEILMVCKQTADGASRRYALPGGGQQPGESLTQTLLRECLEEIGTQVEIDALVHVAEVEKAAPRGAGHLRHQVEFVFRCRVADDYVPRVGERPDKRQVGVEWVGLQQLSQLDVRPEGMAALIRDMAIGQGPVYVGRLAAGKKR